MSSVRDESPTTTAMRKPCVECGYTVGAVLPTNGQDVVRCARCNTYAYNQPRTESGRAVRSTRSNADIRPKVKARVLAAHGHQCISCGRSPAIHGVVLDIDHLIPLALAERHGMLDDLIRSEMNMAPMCAECNRGKQDDVDGLSIQLMYRVLQLKSAH